ncbi:amino acid permease/ SLC12A domain-containing protein [Armillaria novae-zelandiae]|uniref:Amino acid permease/ SLC12A domain-containing protein n=1 Tax=Armillaria novae-zelandiae TaxID=153914 RepID=A0AA39UBL9_9AGAR|nr:amino acid permease/ SLC12A domain-containing protein [Armillaria novae-zelandiae]
MAPLGMVTHANEAMEASKHVAILFGGPTGIIISYIIIGAMLVNVTQALSEMAIMYPVSGSFYTLADRFLDPSFVFAMGWNYCFQWFAALPLKITVAGTTVQYWTDEVPIATWITIFWAVIIIISIFRTLGYTEEEFWSSCLKLLVVVMFIFLRIICIAGGGPKSEIFGFYMGGKYWHDPGAFANGFKGVCSVFVTAGTELVGLAASETDDLRGTMPGAIKGTFWRVTIIYITSLTIIGLMVPWNDDRLIGGCGMSASPFVIALDLANINGLNYLVNATICVSVLSSGLSSVYSASRTLTALAENGYAPRIFAYMDKSSQPLVSALSVLIFAAIAYVNVVAASDIVFDWLQAILGLSVLFTWLSICLCHIWFRHTWTIQGHSIEELPYQAMGGVYGSWLGVVLIILVLIAQFYVASEIDLDSGCKSWLMVEEMRAYRVERCNAPTHIKLWHILFSN